MYEHLKHDLLQQLSHNFTADQLLRICNALDLVSVNYEVQKKSTELAVRGSGLPDLVKTYLVCKKLAGLSELTLQTYRYALQNFFLAVNKAPDEVTSNDIRVFLYQYQEQKQISTRSLDSIRQMIAGFFVWATDEDYLSGNPAKRIPKMKFEVKPRCALTQTELEYLRRSCQTPRDKALLEFLYSTGCRVSELTNVKLSDLDLVTKTVHLYGKGRKHRESFLNAKAEVALRDYLAVRVSDSEYLFVSERAPHNRLTKEAIEKTVRAIAARSEITKHVTPHVFRHTTATTAVQNGMPIESIQIMLGHSQIGTTMIYAHSDLGAIKGQHLHNVI